MGVHQGMEICAAERLGVSLVAQIDGTQQGNGTRQEGATSRWWLVLLLLLIYGISQHEAVELKVRSISTMSGAELWPIEDSAQFVSPPLLSSVDSQVRASRKLLGLEPGGSGLYHSDELFFLSYDRIHSQFKVFVYADPPSESRYHVFTYSSNVSTRGNVVEDLLFKSLVSSKFVTTDPEKADLFVLPISSSRIWESPEVGASKLSHYLKGYVDRQRDHHPYWQRTLGADHVLISCHDFEEDEGRTVLELKKNSIRIACYPATDGEIPDIYPHKDITMPHFIGKSAQEEDFISLEEITTAQRVFLLLTEVVDSSTALTAALSSWKEDPQLLYFRGNATMRRTRMLESKFCLCVENENIQKLVEGLRLGCVPVLMSRHPFHHLPFQDIVNWHQAAIIIHLQEADKLKSLLTGVSDAVYKRMQGLGLQLSHHLSWHFPPVQYDAFHMVMLELWLRRHTVRYARSAGVNSVQELSRLD